MGEKISSEALRKEAEKLAKTINDVGGAGTEEGSKRAGAVSELYQKAVGVETKERTEKGEVQREWFKESGRAVWDLLSGKKVVYNYSEHYGVDITLNPDGSGCVETMSETDFEFKNWDLGENANTGEGRWIEGIHAAKEYVEKVANKIPPGNLEKLGGIPGIAQSFLEARLVKEYSEETYKSAEFDNLP